MMFGEAAAFPNKAWEVLHTKSVGHRDIDGCVVTSQLLSPGLV